MKFVAIDFETANSKRASACAIGLVKVDGNEKQTFQSLIKPHKDFDYFEPVNTGIHGIGPADVKKAPEFIEIWPEIEKFIEGYPLVAHNAGFDMSVLRDVLNCYSIKPQPMSYFCTLVISRQMLDLLSYRLPFVAEELGIGDFAHHDALADAMAAATIALQLAERSNVSTIEELAATLRVRPGLLDETGTSGSTSHQKSHASSYTKEEILAKRQGIDPLSIDTENPCFGKEFVFTGALTLMTRKQAQDAVISRGGSSGAGVTKKTNFLVFGTQEANHLKPGAAFSSKYLRAIEEKGKRPDIEVIDEETFLSFLE